MAAHRRVSPCPFCFFRNAHELHQLKAQHPPNILTTKVQYISTILTIHFKASERLHAVRHFLRSIWSLGPTSGPKSSPGAAHRCLISGYSSTSNTETEVHNEGNQFAGILPGIWKMLWSKSRKKLRKNCWRVRGTLRLAAVVSIAIRHTISLDAEDGIEYSACFSNPSPQEPIGAWNASSISAMC